MVMQLRVEDRFQCAQNFPTWKERITRILDVSDAEEHIDSTKVAPTDSTDLAAWKKIISRAMLIILVLRPGNSQAVTTRDSPQSTFPTS